MSNESAATVRTPGTPRIVGPYELLMLLGSGGMGEVWKARDRVLNRVVALKFLSADALKAATGRDLLHEARSASALNHPNIVTIFQIGESEGTTYLAMEFVEGDTLRALLGKGRLALGDALPILEQIVSALAAAHALGIVHRDLKPENIMLRVDGRVKLLDFGLAKVLPWQDGTAGETRDATSSGEVVGTYRYMSPEQARGKQVGPPSDIFSLGIVMFELLSGEHPFARDSVIDTLNAIVREPSPDLGPKVPQAPPALHALLTRTLEKEPRARYASAKEMAVDLENVSARAQPTTPEPSRTRPQKPWVRAIGIALVTLLGLSSLWGWLRPTSTGNGSTVQSVAVMTLRAQANDARAQPLAEGLPDDLSAALATAGFRVASRSSVVQLGSDATAAMIAAEFGVDAVLAGNVRSSGTTLRVFVELVSVRTRFQVWSGTFTASAEAGAAGTDPQVAQEIATQLRSAVSR